MSISKKITVIIILIVLTNISLLSLLGRNIKTEEQKYIPQTYKLGTLSQAGFIGTITTYDKSPIDISFITPSGRIISKDYIDVYEVDENKHTITAYEDSEEFGEWKIKFYQGQNNTIKFQCITKPSFKIHLTDVKIINIEDEPYIAFKPIMDDSKVKTCSYAIALKSKNHAFSLDSGITNLNETAYVLINPDINAFNGETYTLTLSVCGQIPDEKESKDTASLNVLLPSKPKPIYREIGPHPAETEDTEGATNE